MMKEYQQTKIVLDAEETRALTVLSEMNCGAIPCAICPLSVDKVCLSSIASRVKENMEYDTRYKQAYKVINKE